VNLGGKASIVIFLYSTNNRESFAKVSDDYFTKENVLNLIDDNPTVFLVANDMDAPVREDKGEKMEAAI
jgi:GTPase SAR1 family protein